MECTVGSTLTLETQLYRYLPLEGFLALVETGRVRLTNVNRWEDPGEAILGKVPTRDMSGKIEVPNYSFHERIYGSCWSRLEESDAMWRIYSVNRLGIQIATTVAKFRSIPGIRRGLVAEEMYFETPAELLANASHVPDSLAVALHKRSAFQHEYEVRFLTHADFLDGVEPGQTHINCSVDPTEFIERIVLDPRADDWYVEVMRRYCSRAGLRVQPSKSSLYEPDPQQRLEIERRWVPIARSGGRRAENG